MAISWANGDFPLNPVWDGRADLTDRRLSEAIWELKRQVERLDTRIEAIHDGMKVALAGVDENFAALKSVAERLTQEVTHTLTVHDDHGREVGEVDYDEYLHPIRKRQ